MKYISRRRVGGRWAYTYPEQHALSSVGKAKRKVHEGKAEHHEAQAERGGPGAELHRTAAERHFRAAAYPAGGYSAGAHFASGQANAHDNKVRDAYASQLHKSEGDMDIGDRAARARERLEKGGAHKYKSRKRVGGRWAYNYGDHPEVAAAKAKVNEAHAEHKRLHAIDAAGRGSDTVQFDNAVRAGNAAADLRGHLEHLGRKQVQHGLRKSEGYEDLVKAPARGGKYLYRIRHGNGWRYVYPDDVAHHARPISSKNRKRLDRTPQERKETEDRKAAHGAAPHAAELHADEVHAASRATGGHRMDHKNLDSKGRPIPVPNHNPHEEWNRHRAIIAARVGKVGDTKAHNDSRLGSWSNGSGEGVTSVPELIELATAAEPGFKDIMHASAGAVAGASTFYGPGDKHAIKGAKRLGEKVEEWAQADLEKGKMPTIESARIRVLRQEVSDCLRGSVLVDHPEQIAHVVESLREHARAVGADITVENKWNNDHKGAYTAVHARLYIPSENGPIRTEVQIHPRALIEPKEEMHKVYDVTRAKGFSGDKDTYNASSKLVWTAGMKRLTEHTPTPRSAAGMLDASPEAHEEAARAHEGRAAANKARAAHAGEDVGRRGRKRANIHTRNAEASLAQARAHRVRASAKRGVRPTDVEETHGHLQAGDHDDAEKAHAASHEEDVRAAADMAHSKGRDALLNRAAVSHYNASSHREAARKRRIRAAKG